jgi:hypothetical protein
MFERGKAVIAQYQPGLFAEGEVADIRVTDTGLFFYKVKAKADTQIPDWIAGCNVFAELESPSAEGHSAEDRAGFEQARRESREGSGPTDGTSQDDDCA